MSLGQNGVLSFNGYWGKRSEESLTKPKDAIPIICLGLSAHHSMEDMPSCDVKVSGYTNNYIPLINKCAKHSSIMCNLIDGYFGFEFLLHDITHRICNNGIYRHC